MTPHWQPYREPFRTTAARTLTIAVIGSAVLAGSTGGSLARWPAAMLLALWPALGGHYVELWFLNWLRPRLPHSRALHMAIRVMVWFVGGCLLAACMFLTAVALNTAGRPPRHWNAAWPKMCLIGGLIFVAIELFVHFVLHLRGKPSLYNERGYPIPHD